MLTPIQKGSPLGLLPPLHPARRAPSFARPPPPPPPPRSPIPTGLGPTELWIQQDCSGERVKGGESKRGREKERRERILLFQTEERSTETLR